MLEIKLECEGEKDMAELSQILTVARDILSNAGRKGMHVQDIAEAAVLQNKNMSMSTEDFCKKVSSALAQNLKLKATKPTFAKVNWDKGSKKGKPRQGWYRLRQDRVPSIASVVQAPKVGSTFLGKAGEYAVMSELLFWEYNASMMAVDDGVDIVASKGSKFFHIQVKTATCQDSGKYLFTISHAAYNRYPGYNVFYVFVLRQSLRSEFIILPRTILEHFINKQVVTGSSSYSITIISDPKKCVLNGKEDVTAYYGKFGDIIK